jgi:hypothetical protein
MVMSALPPKADVCSAQAHVCFGPIADIRTKQKTTFLAVFSSLDQLENLRATKLDKRSSLVLVA